jgi:hypothetical protein
MALSILALMPLSQAESGRFSTGPSQNTALVVISGERVLQEIWTHFPPWF